MLIRNANCTRAVFAFWFVLECCKTKWVRFERFCACLVLQKAVLATEGSTINNFLMFRSVHFHPTPFTRPSFSIFQGSGSETSLGGGERGG